MANWTSNLTSNTAYDNLFTNLQLFFLSWYLPVVVLLGTFGNIFCLIFLFKSKLFPNIILIWLVSICLSDLLILQTDAFRMMLKIWTGFDIRDQGEVVCRLHNYLSNFFFYWSAYCQAALSVQRLYFIMRPFKGRQITYRRILIFWTTLLVVILLPNIPYILYWHISKQGDCEPIDKVLYYTTSLFDLIISGIIPLLLMTVTTVVMSVQVYQTSTVGIKHGQDNSSRVTRLLVSMNIVYMLSTYPLLVYIMHLNFGLQNKVGITIDKSLHKFFYYFFRALCYLNTCTNWIFYCVAGKVFRTRAVAIIRGSVKRDSRHSSSGKRYQEESGETLPRQSYVKTNIPSL